MAVLGGCSYVRQDPGCRECSSAEVRSVRTPAMSPTTWSQRDLAGRSDKSLLVPAGPVDPLQPSSTLRPNTAASTGTSTDRTPAMLASASTPPAAPVETPSPAAQQTLPPIPPPPQAQGVTGRAASLPEKDPAAVPPKPMPSQVATAVQALTITSAESVSGPSLDGSDGKPAKPKDLKLGTNEATVVRTLTPHTPAMPKNTSGPVVRIVNKKRITLNYEVHDVGPSGVSGVELWYTRDSKDWKKHDGPPEKKPPYIIEVQEEGLYGFTLLAKNGIGLSKDPPKSGDQPQVWVEVDLTKPAVALGEVKAGYENKVPSLTVQWKASDKNLGGQPIALAYAEKEDGPWQPIATGLENSGRYVWPLRPGLPPRIFVRIEAKDLAGNLGAAKTPSPVQVDLSQPVVQVLDVEVQ
jgi:hypothetical protein